MAKAQAVAPPKGWIQAGSNPKDYEMSCSETVQHSGSRCAQILSKSEKIDGFGTLMQWMDATEYRGKHLKLSAYIKCEDVVDWAGLWMSVDAGKEIASFDNMQGRPIKGKQDWRLYEVVLDVPKSSTDISFGVLLSGTGHVWFDDCEILPVSNETATTDLDRSCGIRYQNPRLSNLDFSEGSRSDNSIPSLQSAPKGWFQQMFPPSSYTTGIDSKKSGDEAAFIQNLDEQTKETGWGALLQAVAAEPYAGKRLKLSGDLKTIDVDGSASLWLGADCGRKLEVCHDYMEDRKTHGTNDWKRYECVIDIPAESDNINFGAVLEGKGKVLLRNVQVELVSNKVPTTGAFGSPPKPKVAMNRQKKEKSLNHSPTNLDFEQSSHETADGLPVGWIKSGNSPDHYKMVVDSTTLLDGHKTAMVEALNAEHGFGTLMQNVDPLFCKGKRMRISAHIRTKDAGWAALWMRIDGPDGKHLGFDNMQKNPIKGTTDWNQYECVLDVPDESTNLAFGLLLSGQGKAWLSNVAVDEVSQDVPTTDQKEILDRSSKPRNLNFEE